MTNAPFDLEAAVDSGKPDIQSKHAYSDTKTGPTGPMKGRESRRRCLAGAGVLLICLAVAVVVVALAKVSSRHNVKIIRCNASGARASAYLGFCLWDDLSCTCYNGAAVVIY